MSDFKTVETRDLTPGMVLRWTGATVMTHPTAGISTRRSKVDFIVKNKNGSMIQKSWNRHTLIAVSI
jgi:hypothetical protein